MLHKKTTFRSTNGGRIEGHVMVLRTDIADGSTGQARPGNDRMCRRALNGALIENNPSPEPLSASHSANKKCCRFLAAVVARRYTPSDLELLAR
jgi:hypothetical protein